MNKFNEAAKEAYAYEQGKEDEIRIIPKKDYYEIIYNFGIEKRDVGAVKLNLGCCKNYKFGYVNCDIDKNVRADIHCDFNKKLPFKDNSVDLVLAENILEHLPNPLNFMLEIKRILKKGAVATIVTDNASYIIYHFPRKKAFHDSYNYGHHSEDKHYFLFLRGHLEALIRKAGLRIRFMDYDYGPGKFRNIFVQKFIALFFGKKFGYANWRIDIVK